MSVIDLRLLALLSAATVAGASGAAPLLHLAGDLHTAATPSVFASVGEMAGSFTLDSAGESDLRLIPGWLVITTPNGTLTAEAPISPRLNGVRRIDADSGRPLRADAPPGATCSYGSEADCWHQGDPMTGNAGIFDALCATTLGYSGIDRSACALRIGNSTVGVLNGVPDTSPSISEFFGSVYSGSNSGRSTVLNFIIGGAGSYPSGEARCRCK